MSVAASTSGTTNQGLDLTPPSIVVSQPARGAFLPAGPVQVTGVVTDVGSGVANLTVQGSSVPFDATGHFSTSVTLPEGVQPISITANDNAGNRTTRTISVETGTYLPLSQTVPDALAGRINASSFPVMEQIAATEIASVGSSIGATLMASNPIASGGGFDVSITSASFGPPGLAISSGPQGIAVTISVSQVSIAVDAKGTILPISVSGGFSADEVTVQATAHLGADATGGLAVTFPSVDVSFQNFKLNLPGWIAWLSFIIEPIAKSQITSIVENMLKTDGASTIDKLVDQTALISLGGTPAQFSYDLSTISTDASGIAFDTGANLTLQPDPSYPTSPGSLLTAGALPTSFSTQSTIVFSISQSMVNRALHEAWQSGMLATVVIPSQFAQAFGTALPFGSTAQDMVNFFPQLQPVVPAQDLSQPLIYRIRSLLPPTVTFIQGAPDPLNLRFGEYDITASIDTGGAPLDLFTVSMHAEIQIGVAIQNGALVPVMTSLPNPPIASDLIAEPLVPLGAAHIESYLDSIISMVMGGIVTNIPPIPLPSLPAGLTLTNVNIHADGPTDAYLTIEADLQ
jgi:hypothetical protein